VAVATAKRKIEAISLSYTAEGHEEWLKEKKEK